MQKNILNYRIFIDKEKNVYTAYCPTLGLNDFGKTIDEAIERMTQLITFHIESLAELGHTIPVERETTTVITSINIPKFPHMKLAVV